MDKEIEIVVQQIADSQIETGAYALILKERDGERNLVVIIGAAEAQSITLKVAGIQSQRPLTHDLLKTVIDELKATVQKVLIYKAEKGIFCSNIYLENSNNEMLCIDSRTSDAIALALRCNVPIYIYDSILEKEKIKMTKEYTPESMPKKQNTLESLKESLNKAVAEENYELASILKDKIDKIKSQQ
ncbi:MAG: bifunctional nuclease family protein [Bacteroides sp.]|nr:bifunctional nuclease family protein [Bacteroides sp.]MDD2645521.1 bifunctional nuclease family protein [Bacteroides sp.]MDD4054681.1 bifunctional nuclease family protein [Bacteroides sp.]MDD4720127.1 bifunctional nuclease family protein [Bacteroides sp.]NLI64326.1 bifunctional nuclease family protein [Bacteroidales bacterium]